MGDNVDMSCYIIPNDVPVCQLDCQKAFNALNMKEKLYCHYLSKACEEGGLIVLVQTSPESIPIFLLMQGLFSKEGPNLREKALKDGVSESDFEALLAFAAGFYSNMGNYKSFGDTKIVPGLTKENFWIIVKCSDAYEGNKAWFDELWEKCSDDMYSLKPRRRELGIGEGVSTYYSSNISKADISLVQDFMKEQNISPYNTRLFKTENEKLELRLASLALSEKVDSQDSTHCLLKEYTYKDRSITITRGDYSGILKRVIEHLKLAKTYAANENEVCMIENYIRCFTYGSIESHKEGSRYWIRDKGPIVETYIGFIESYRDPYGVRGEFEGFVSIVNKEMSIKFGKLVEAAQDLLAKLPWPKEYEKDVFLRPDFTSLDVVTFSGSGVPAGINIPNYDDIRQNEGFKNVSLGNVLQAKPSGQKITFLTDADQEHFENYKSPSFEVQVGLHELIGHGSGKLFKEMNDGTFNFDKDNVLHLEKKSKISTWYAPGETWDTKFSTYASSYEECRAECVGLLLCLDATVLKIFGHEGEEAEAIVYANWLSMVRAGLLGLEFYSPQTKSWKQAHMNARYVILQVLMETGNELVNIEERTGEDGKPDLLITLNKDLIKTVGKDAISNFLMRLQLYKSTADFESGKEMYEKYSSVDDVMLNKRTIVLNRKQARRLLVQCNSTVIGEKVRLDTYDASLVGLVKSNVQRYLAYDQCLESLWYADRKANFHSY